MPKKHHTKRVLNARRKAIKKWKKGLISRGLPLPTKEQCEAFITAFNMGVKEGRRQVNNPNKQQSKWKPVLDALCRFKDPISWKQASKLLGCTEEALEKHLDNYEYIPSCEDLSYSRRQDRIYDLDKLRF